MRKSRRNHYNRKKSRMNFATVIVIITVAVIMGIMTAKMIIYFINLPEITQSVPENDANAITGSSITSQGAVITPEATKDVPQADVQSITEATGSAVKIIEDKLVSGYYIQYGSFSTNEAANALAAKLNASGIAAQIVEKSGAYKVVGELFADKTSAQKALEGIDRNNYKDVFVTMI